MNRAVASVVTVTALCAASPASAGRDERARPAYQRASASAAAASAAASNSDSVIVNGTRFRPRGQVTNPPRVAGKSWAVVDLPTGRILAVHKPRRALAPGSTMKLLTAITAVRRVARFPQHRVTGREAAMICSCAGLVAGRRYARADLLAGLLIPSGNDAAETLAGSDPVSRAAFIRAMNANAHRSQLSGTHAGNPSGLDHAAGYSTSRDLLILLRAAYRRARIAPYLDTLRTIIGPIGGPDHVVVHRTPYVHEYPSSIAAKSGTTSRAGKVLVAITKIKGRLIGVALMGSPGDRVTTDVRALTLWTARHREQLAPLGHLP